MSGSILFLVFLMAFSMTATPGPANIVLVGMASSYGFRASLPFLLGVGCGFLVLALTMAVGLASVIEHNPMVLVVFKYIGAAYLLWLAYKIGSSRKIADTRRRVPGFFSGFVVHPLNPKAWMMLITALGQFVDPSGDSLGQSLTVVFIFSLTSLFSNTLWCAVGATLRDWLSQEAWLVVFNRSMALILLGLVIWILLR